LTHTTRPALVPELQVQVATELMPTWDAVERHFGHAVPPPYWSFLWPGSEALARVLLDRPELAAGRRVFDFGAGCGLAAIAAARAGAARVVACDTDPLAATSQQVNARLNDVEIESLTLDPVGRLLADMDLVLAGDVCYERGAAVHIAAWLRQLAAVGIEVVLADPGRAYAPRDGLEVLAAFDVATTRELENADSMRTVVWRVR
jgi:predicted nicotinamide N-methyase